MIVSKNDCDTIMYMDTQNKDALIAEKNLLIEELNNLGVHDPETNTWNAVAQKDPGEETESDENDLADHMEDLEERNAKIGVLTQRLQSVEEKISTL